MKIQKYEDDNSISLEDKVIGTDAEDVNKTKNYSFRNIVAFLRGQGLGSDSEATIDGSETKIVAGQNVTMTGEGTTTSPYVVNAVGGSQDLQSVLNEDEYAEVDGGNSYVQLLGGTSNERYFDLTTSNGVYGTGQFSTTLNIDKNKYISANVFNNEVSRIIQEYGVFQLHREAADTNKKTVITIDKPTEETILKFPAKPTAGTYTIATLDDIQESNVNNTFLSNDGKTVTVVNGIITSIV